MQEKTNRRLCEQKLKAKQRKQLDYETRLVRSAEVDFVEYFAAG